MPMQRRFGRRTCGALLAACLAGRAYCQQESPAGTATGTPARQAPANTAGAAPARPELSTKPPIGQRYIYKVVDGRELHLWVVEPTDQSNRSARPAIVFYHGGGLVSGGPNQFNYESEYLASRGMVAVQVEYRLLPEADKSIFPTICIEDAKSAMRWVKAHAQELGVDTNHIAAAGGSAGGYLAAYMGTIQQIDAPDDDLKISPKPNAIILFNGVIDNGPAGWGYQHFGEKYKIFSPAYNVTSSTPPTLSMSGTKDTLIPPASVRSFKAAMKSAGVRCDVILYPDQEHGFFNYLPFAEQTTRATDEFLISLGWLKGSPTIGAVSQTP